MLHELLLACLIGHVNRGESWKKGGWGDAVVPPPARRVRLGEAGSRGANGRSIHWYSSNAKPLRDKYGITLQLPH